MFRCLVNVLLISIAANSFGAFQLFEEEGKVGLKNEQGVVVLPPAFDALGWSDKSFSVVGEITGYKLSGGWGLINLKKEFITKAEYESLIYCGADRVVAIKKVSRISRKAGSLKLTGEVTIPFQYDAITLHGLRAVVMNKTGVEYRFGLVDLDNKIILPLEFQNIYPVSTLRFAVENKEGKIALYSDEGKQVTGFFIDSISAFHRNYAVIHSDGNLGLMDSEGNVLAETKYRDIQFLDNGSIRALQPDTWKIINVKNIEENSLRADELNIFSSRYYKVTNGTKQGLIDRELKPAWPADYDYIGSVKNDLIPIKKYNKWGLVDINQSEIIPFGFDSLLWDGELAFGLDQLTGKKQWSVFNIAEKTKAPKKYDSVERLNNTFIKIKKNGYFGLLTREGREIIHCVYDSILELKKDLVCILFKGQFGIVSVNEDWILPPQTFPIQLVNSQFFLEHQSRNVFLKSFSGDIIYFTENPLEVREDCLLEHLPSGFIKRVGFDGVEIKNIDHNSAHALSGETISNSEVAGLRLFQSEGKFGFKDEQERLIIPNRYDSLKPFSDKMAGFKLLGKWGYINTDDKIIVNPSFDMAGYFINGFAIVAKNKKYGVIDKKGTVRLSLQYDSITPAKDKLLIYLAGKTGLATAEGKILVEPRYDYLQILSNDQLLVKLDQQFGIISFDGLSIVPIIYSSIQYDEDKNLYLARLSSQWTTLVLKN